MVTLKPAGAAPAPRAYHHGNLRQALVQAALELAMRDGPERVSVREAARRLGVSPGAPFRHFPTRRALMTAVAEEANERLALEVRRALAREKGNALARLHAIGTGYLQFVLRHPAHFRIVSAREEIDVAGSAALRAGMQEVRGLTEQTLREAQAEGGITRAHDAAALALLARAAAYGLARMQLDGHFAQWGVPAGGEAAAMDSTLRLLLGLMAADA